MRPSHFGRAAALLLLTSCGVQEFRSTQALPEDAEVRLQFIAEGALRRVQQGSTNPWLPAMVHTCGSVQARRELHAITTAPAPIQHAGDCATLLWRMRTCNPGAYGSITGPYQNAHRAWELARKPDKVPRTICPA